MPFDAMTRTAASCAATCCAKRHPAAMTNAAVASRRSFIAIVYSSIGAGMFTRDQPRRLRAALTREARPFIDSDSSHHSRAALPIRTEYQRFAVHQVVRELREGAAHVRKMSHHHRIGPRW